MGKESVEHPQELGRYRVRRVLGRGAMGVVYLAEDPVIGRQVAVKVVRAFVGLGPEEIQLRQDRFEREFRSAGSLSHPNIVTVYDVGKDEESSFIAMEYIPGETLEDVLESGRHLSLREAYELARALGSALDYAHSRDIVHRDIKPANVLLAGDGTPKLSDFGIAKLNTAQATTTGTVMGTPAYMSPEQITGDKITGASDQFSLAVLLYQVLTGHRPFSGDNPTTMMYRIIHGTPAPPRQLNGSLPAAIDAVMLKAMAKAPAERYASCTEFADALTAALGGSAGAGAVRIDPTAATASFERVEVDLEHGDGAATAEGRSGRKAALAVGLLVAVLAVAAAGWLVWQRNGGGAGPASAAEAAAPAAVQRSLEVASEPPGAEIWVDGADRGLITPALVALTGAPGQVVELELRRDGEPAARAEMILGDATPERWAPTLAPPPERLTVASEPPGATVVYDGETLTETTPVELRLTPDTGHTLELALDGHQTVRRSLTWDELADPVRQTRRLEVKLPEIVPPGHLVVEAPYPVEVTVDGSRRSGGRIALEPGTHRVTATAPTVFLADTRSVEVTSGREAKLSLPPAHPVSVAATPSNCRVSVDGRDVGFVPLDLRLSAGSHELDFTWESLGKTVRKTVDVGPGTGRIFAAAPDS